MVTGAKGQDGSILVRKLKAQGHQVLGVARDSAEYYEGTNSLKIGVSSLSEPSSCFELLESFKPELILHFAAVHAPTMVEDGTLLGDAMVACHVATTENILTWQRENLNTKFIVALSSQMYSPTHSKTFVNEKSQINPSTFYGETKAEAYRLIREARNLYGINAAGAILFNHTSEFSKADFLFPILARKIASGIRSSHMEISVRNANAYLDIGSAVEYCDGILKMAEQEKLSEFVFSSNEAKQVSEIIQESLSLVGYIGEIDILSEAQSVPNYLKGNPQKAKDILNWSAKKNPSQVLSEMVCAIL
jgi:GDPmannose 4,6-dehydratase